MVVAESLARGKFLLIAHRLPQHVKRCARSKQRVGPAAHPLCCPKNILGHGEVLLPPGTPLINGSGCSIDFIDG